MAGFRAAYAVAAGQIALAGRADAERDADGLIALIDGLNYDIVAGSRTAASAKAILRAQLDYVFMPPAKAGSE